MSNDNLDLFSDDSGHASASPEPKMKPREAEPALELGQGGERSSKAS